MISPPLREIMSVIFDKNLGVIIDKYSLIIFCIWSFGSFNDKVVINL